VRPERRGEVLVIQHVGPEGPGIIAEALRARGLVLRVVRADRGEPVPDRPEGFAAIAVLGGPMGAYQADRHPHLADEVRLLERALRRGVPTLGICLGSQLLAAALGAGVRPAAAKEIGWIPVELTSDAGADELFRAAPRTFVPLQWHGDAFDLPRGAASLARSELTACQAFRCGASAWGLLFHLEATAHQVAAMAVAFADELRSAGVDGAALARAASDRLADLRPVASSALGAWAELARAHALATR